MKLAADLSTQFNQGPWPSSVQAAGTCDFRTLEMQLIYAEIAASDLRAGLGQQGVEAVSINTPVGEASDNRFGFAAHRGEQSALSASVVTTVLCAAEIGASHCVVHPD